LLHGFEYAVSLGREAIAKWLWGGGEVMVAAG
jgi:hypothetical protein